MSKSQSNSGTVDVDDAIYDWHLQREPRQSDDASWKGMTISLLQRDAKREAWVQFPPPTPTGPAEDGPYQKVWQSGEGRARAIGDFGAIFARRFRTN